ncbi:hypothetical protein CDD83_4791 [Cordyceps sp. RAO-2017]|nr:hypothetical protein CDD83_4791 [Cordyceps sp. RAO-2017]
MSKHQTKGYPIDKRLDPQLVFPGIVKKSDVVQWERKLKKILTKWMQDPDSPFQAVRDELGAGLFCADSESEKSEPSEREDFTDDFGVELPTNSSTLFSMALPLLTSLHSRGALPAILFNYNREDCERTLFEILSQLKSAESTWKEESTEWHKKIEAFENWKNVQVQTGKNKKKEMGKGKSQHGSGMSKEEQMREEASKEASPWQSFDPKAPIDLFSFADRTKLLDSELEPVICRLTMAEVNPKVIEGLRRGIAVHHAGMNRQYRQVVEMLFRKGFLTAVVATGTLALGINMPCKTVVFFGDSIFLTALSYLQAAGRAGRRGFDILGNVVFAGMPHQRVFEIMSSRLPDLRGHFPLSTSLILRLMGLLHRTGNSEFADRAIRSLLSQTRLYLGGPSDQMTRRHHLRFSIEYLRRQNLFSRDGTPLNFSGLVGHLYFTEDSVFGFHALLKEGYFHQVCEGIYRNPKAVLLKLALVLSHLFCRTPVHGSLDKEVVRRSPSVVWLPDLPSQAEKILARHNKETLETFRTYVSTFVKQHLSTFPDTRLPFTGFDVQPRHEEMDAAPAIRHLPPTQIRSPFAALSGFTDEFESIHDLCSTVRGGVFLEESAVPYIAVHKGRWNAYVYDFFKHGGLDPLVKDNGIKKEDVWFRLKDFSRILAIIVTSLTNFFKLDVSMDDAMMDVQEVGDMMQGDDPPEDEDKPKLAAGAKDATVAKAAAVTNRKPKKEKVIDSWSDEFGDDGAEVDDEVAKQDRTCSSSPGTPDPPGVLPVGENGDASLRRVLLSFQMLRIEFDEKFWNVWA